MASNAAAFARLQGLIGQFAPVASGEFEHRVAVNLAEEAITQLRMGFREQRDPYGTPWAHLVGRSGQALMNTGRLRNSFTRIVTSTGFSITTNVSYAAPHQYGATVRAKNKYVTFKVGGRWARKAQVTIPKRQMMPERSLGPIWSRAFAQTASKLLRHQFKR